MRAFLVLLAACGGQLSTPIDSGAPADGSGTDSPNACSAETRPGQSVLVACVTKASIHSDGGGFGPPPPPGSNCHGEATITLELATSNLDWATCSIANDPKTPWTLTTGHRTLSATEASSAVASMRKIVVSSGGSCGADKPTETFTVTLPAATQQYTDSFYSCQGAGKIYVDNIDQAFGTLGALAHP